MEKAGVWGGGRVLGGLNPFQNYKGPIGADRDQMDKKKTGKFSKIRDFGRKCILNFGFALNM